MTLLPIEAVLTIATPQQVDLSMSSLPVGAVVSPHSGPGNTGENLQSPASVGGVMEWRVHIQEGKNFAYISMYKGGKAVPHKIDSIIQW